MLPALRKATSLTRSTNRTIARTSLRAYGKLCSVFYQLDKPEAPSESLQYYKRKAEQAQGSLLEPMCGTGRFLIPLAQRGHDITGFDTSKEMLDICRKKCNEAGVSPRLTAHSFSDFPQDRKFSLVFIPTSSFSLITTPEAVTQALNTVRNCLQPDGKFIFEVDSLCTRVNPELKWAERSVRVHANETIYLRTCSAFNVGTRVQKTLCLYQRVEGSKVTEEEEELLDVRLYEPGELVPTLEEHGFKVTRELTPYSTNLPIQMAETLLYECTLR